MRKPPGCCAQCLNENRGDWLRPYGLRVARWAIEERHFRCASDSHRSGRAGARQIAPYLQTQLVISVAAGIRIAALARWLGGYSRIVRAMPNLPASIGL